jgi:hypothetical protein
MIVHLALNQNYLLIGLFQDNFPVTILYAKIFHSRLKKLYPEV